MDDEMETSARRVISRWKACLQLWEIFEDSRDSFTLDKVRATCKTARAEAQDDFPYISEQYGHLAKAIKEDLISENVITQCNSAFARIRTAIRSHIFNRWPHLKPI